MPWTCIAARPTSTECLFIASPLNADNRADAMALSVETSIMRCANDGRPFTSGLYLGRHVNGDIYSVVPPAEAIATHVAGGAKRMHNYGYSGLDDGGVLCSAWTTPSRIPFVRATAGPMK